MCYIGGLTKYEMHGGICFGCYLFLCLRHVKIVYFANNLSDVQHWPCFFPDDGTQDQTVLTSETDGFEVGDATRLTEILRRLGGAGVEGVTLKPIVVQVESHTTVRVLARFGTVCGDAWWKGEEAGLVGSSTLHYLSLTRLFKEK